MSDPKVSAAVASLYNTYPFPQNQSWMNHHLDITGAGIGKQPIVFVLGKSIQQTIFGFLMLVVDQELVQNI